MRTAAVVVVVLVVLGAIAYLVTAGLARGIAAELAAAARAATSSMEAPS